MQLKWTDLALQDLDRIESYIAEDAGPVRAVDVVLRVLDSVALVLPSHPMAGRKGRVKHTREWVIDGLPFVIVYRHNQIAKSLEILRVLHDAQLWPPLE